MEEYKEEFNEMYKAEVERMHAAMEEYMHLEYQRINQKAPDRPFVIYTGIEGSLALEVAMKDYLYGKGWVQGFNDEGETFLPV